MNKLIIILSLLVLTGCSTIPTESPIDQKNPDIFPFPENLIDNYIEPGAYLLGSGNDVYIAMCQSVDECMIVPNTMIMYWIMHYEKRSKSQSY